MSRQPETDSLSECVVLQKVDRVLHDIVPFENLLLDV